jgi:hypothetical protein
MDLLSCCHVDNSFQVKMVSCFWCPLLRQTEFSFDRFRFCGLVGTIFVVQNIPVVRFQLVWGTTQDVDVACQGFCGVQDLKKEMSVANIHMQRNKMIASVHGRTPGPASTVEAATSCHNTKSGHSTTISHAPIDANVESNVIYV